MVPTEDICPKCIFFFGNCNGYVSLYQDFVSSNSVCNHTYIGLPLHIHPILLITCMITNQIGLHLVLLPLLMCHTFIHFNQTTTLEWQTNQSRQNLKSKFMHNIKGKI